MNCNSAFIKLQTVVFVKVNMLKGHRGKIANKKSKVHDFLNLKVARGIKKGIYNFKKGLNLLSDQSKKNFSMNS